MTTTLDPDGMRQLALRHGASEAAHDWDGAMATMGDEPYYEFFPFRLRISGEAPIRELWLRLFGDDDGGEGIRCFDRRYSEGAHDLWEALGDDSLLQIINGAFVDERGDRSTTTILVRFRYGGDRISSETLWICDHQRPYFDAIFDGSFRELAGVEEF
jgi:hypothetical protein